MKAPFVQGLAMMEHAGVVLPVWTLEIAVQTTARYAVSYNA